MINRQSVLGRIVKIAFLGGWLVISLFPLYWIVVTSIKPPGEIYTFPPQYWPSRFTLDNYINLFRGSNFGRYMLNSATVAVVAGLIATLIAMFSAYVLARFQFRSKSIVIMVFFATQLIPGFIALAPLYLMMVNFKLVDSMIGLMLVYIAGLIPFSTVMLRGFFLNIPDELEEAAMIDGCSRVSALFRVIVPIMRPGVMAAFMFCFVGCWNELFLSTTLMNKDSNKTIPTALNGFISGFNIDWASMSTASVLAIIPTMLMFAFASRHIIEGLSTGAVKG